MVDSTTVVDQWEVKDLEDNSVITVLVTRQAEMGNAGLPGLQIVCMGRIVNYEPGHVERWAYAAKKARHTEHLILDGSWITHEDTYVKQFLLISEVLKARIEIKVRSKDAAIIKEYDLPFKLDA